MESV